MTIEGWLDGYREAWVRRDAAASRRLAGAARTSLLTRADDTSPA